VANLTAAHLDFEEFGRYAVELPFERLRSDSREYRHILLAWFSLRSRLDGPIGFLVG